MGGNVWEQAPIEKGREMDKVRTRLKESYIGSILNSPTDLLISFKARFDQVGFARCRVGHIQV